MTSSSSTDELKQAVNDASQAVSQTVDASITVVARTVAKGLQAGQGLATDVYDVACTYRDIGKEYVDSAIASAKAAEDVAVDVVKEGLGYVSSHPYTAYPAVTTAALLALPGTRRMLWRITFGRLVTPESVINKSQSRVELLNSKLTDYSAQIQKLEERARLAEEEFNRSYQNLRGARQEFQRLASQLTSSQWTAQGVLQDLRSIKKVDDSLALRGQAASQAATLKSQLAQVNKAILRIARKDI